MIQKIVLSQFLEYVKKYNPDYINVFSTKNVFNKASYIIYLHECIKHMITQQNTLTNSKDTENSETSLFIPINVDTM